SKPIYRNVAIILGIICIFLVAVVIDFQVVMNNMNNTIQADSNQIRSLKSQVDDLTGILNFAGTDIEPLLYQNETVQAGQTLDVYNLTAASYSGDVIVE